MRSRESILRWLRRDKGAEGPNAYSGSDAELAAQLRLGDEHAFLYLYDRYSRVVYRFLAHMTGSLDRAEELTQEVFVAVLDAISVGTIRRFDPEKGTMEGYLLGIARNLARAARRSEHRMVSLDSMLETPEWEMLSDCVENGNRAEATLAVVIARTELRALYRAILDLPIHYREVVVLCSLQEKSYREASVLLQVTEGTIASRMNRAKTILAAKLQKSQSEQRSSV